MNTRVTQLFITLMACTLLLSCGEDDVLDEVNINNHDPDIDDRVENVEKIFYSIPSPVETVQLLHQAGATYNMNYVNDPEYFKNYLISPKRMALNLGVYGADLSYNSVFDRTEENMYTFQACDRIAEELGLSDAFDNTLFERVEANYNDRDSMIDLIADAYWTTDDYLRENKRHSIAAMVIAGGWIEGLYIATQMAKDQGSELIVERVVEQKYSLENLMNLVESYRTDDQLDDIIADLSYLKQSFDKITIDYTPGGTSLDPETGITTIGGTNDISYNPAVLDEITTRVAEIRGRYIE